MIAQLDKRMIREAPGRTTARLASYFLFEGRPLTAPGQWWNPITFANLRLSSKRSGCRTDSPVFVVGMGRSGTTLLGRLLAVHPDIGFLNEPKALWHVAYPHEDIIGSYGSPESGRLYLGAEDASSDVIERTHAMFSWFKTLTRSRRIVDKYPELVFRRDFVRTIFPDARFLIVTRSPGPTLASVSKWSEAHGEEFADWWGLRNQKWRILWKEAVVDEPENFDIEALRLGDTADHAVRAAVEWVVTMRASIAASRDPGAMIVGYDRLVESPVEQVRSVVEFCGVPPSVATERFAQHTVVRRRDSGKLPESLPADLAVIVTGTQKQLSGIGGCLPPQPPGTDS